MQVLPTAVIEQMHDWAAALERDQTFEMFTIILSAAASLDLKTAALNQLLQLSATSAVAQVSWAASISTELPEVSLMP